MSGTQTAAARQRARFEELLVEELDTNSRLKRAVESHRAAQVEASTSMALAGDALAQLLDGLARKTSPLHLRMVHALGRLYQEQPADADGTELVVMVNEVCDMIRRPDLKTPLT